MGPRHAFTNWKIFTPNAALCDWCNVFSVEMSCGTSKGLLTIADILEGAAPCKTYTGCLESKVSVHVRCQVASSETSPTKTTRLAAYLQSDRRPIPRMPRMLVAAAAESHTYANQYAKQCWDATEHAIQDRPTDQDIHRRLRLQFTSQQSTAPARFQQQRHQQSCKFQSRCRQQAT